MCDSRGALGGDLKSVCGINPRGRAMLKKNHPVLLTLTKQWSTIIVEKYHQYGDCSVERPLHNVITAAWLKVSRIKVDSNLEMRDISFANTKQKKLARSVLVSLLSDIMNNDEIAQTLKISGMTVANSVNAYKALVQSEKLESLKQEILQEIERSQKKSAPSTESVTHRGEATANKDQDEIEAHIRGRIRQRRKQLNMSIGHAAAKLNITAQQWHKYEKGENRVPAARLFEISVILDRPISFFFPEEPSALSKDISTASLFTKEQKGEILRIIKDTVGRAE